MKAFSVTRQTLLAASALIACAAVPAHAQLRTSPPASSLMVAPPTPDADALAAEMRVLAKDPKNVEALTKAGELTLKLGDPTAAANLFARADDVEPNNGRLKADEAAVLVHLERPGEALRLFQQAVTMGADPASFAAERGLAYDLIGQQERAQRDYRLALKTNPDDAETIRRYALSLGISGKRKDALDALDPLVRRQDHAGWRDRAFVFALTGDADQAKKIATAMLPDQMSSGLAPFFDRLGGLSPTDKAFAVHFGELQVTPERLADARMTPPLPAFQSESGARQVAEVALPPVPEARTKKQRRKNHDRDQPAEVAPATQAARSPAAPQQVAANRQAAPTPVQVKTASVRHPIAQAPVPTTTAPATKAPMPAATSEKPATRVGEEDRIVDRIATGGASPSPVPQAPVQAAPAVPQSTVAATPSVSPAAEAAAKAKELEAANLAAVKKVAAKKAAAKAAAEAKRKAEADKKAAAAKKAADEKAAAEKRAKEKEEKANPSRIWVQVAGGAYEGDLPKAWARVKAKAPEAFKSRSGWTTPLNATNRVLAGPFKSDDAAQDFINDLAKKGIHAFPFTSTKGQKIDKLSAK